MVSFDLLSVNLEKEMPDYLVCLIGRQFYGITVNFIKEIVIMSDIIELPFAPDYMKGVMNFQNEVIPVLKTEKLLLGNSSEDEVLSQLALIFDWNYMPENTSIAMPVSQTYGVVEFNKFYFSFTSDQRFKKTSFSKGTYNWNKIPIQLIDDQKLTDYLFHL